MIVRSFALELPGGLMHINSCLLGKKKWGVLQNADNAVLALKLYWTKSRMNPRDEIFNSNLGMGTHS